MRMNRGCWVDCIGAVLVAVILVGCLPQPVPEAPTPPHAPTAQSAPAAAEAPTDLAMLDVLSRPTLARGYLTTPNELTRIARLARAGVEPYKTAVAAALDYAAKIHDKESLSVPDTIDIESGNSDDPAYLHLGAKYVYAWAVAYNLLKESESDRAQQYAQAAYDMVMEMPRRNTQVSGYQQNTRLNIAIHIQNWVYAADLLSDWPVPASGTPFARSDDAQKLKAWLGAVTIRYPYNAAHIRVNNWGAWGRLTTAVIADYVGDGAPLYVQQVVKDARGAYQVDPDKPCDADGVKTCVTVDAGAMYADAIRLHFDVVDGKMYELSAGSCDANGSKSMIRADGGIPDELRRQFSCDVTDIADPDGPAAHYSLFANDAMVSLAELAWRRGDPSLYTHIDAATGRGALYRSAKFLLDNNIKFTRGSMLELVNRFYTYQSGIEQDAARLKNYRELLSMDLPGFLKRQDDWPEDAGWISFGTLTHGFAAAETLRPPPTVAPRKGPAESLFEKLVHPDER